MKWKLFSLAAVLFALVFVAAGCQSEPAVILTASPEVTPAPTAEPTVTSSPEKEQFIAACRAGAEDWAQQMASINERWTASMSRADRTNLPALSTSLVALRQVNREAQGVEPPACIAALHEEYLDGQQIYIDFIFDLLEDPDMDLAPYSDQLQEAQFQLYGLEFALDIYQKSPENFAEGLWEDKIYQEQQAGGAGQP